MRAICVTEDRRLELREVPMPADPPPGCLLVDIDAAAINHGDKTFLASPMAAGGGRAPRLHDVRGASASGTVVALGPGAPAAYAGRQVAIYRSLSRNPHTLGLWCQEDALIAIVRDAAMSYEATPGAKAVFTP